MAIFPYHVDQLKQILGFLNSSVCAFYMTFLSPTLNVKIGHIENLPFIENVENNQFINNIVSNCIVISNLDWDSFETSWNFIEHPFAKSDIRRQTSESEVRSLKSDVSIRLEDCWLAWQQECEERFRTLKANEEALNRIFIDIYGLQDELTPEVEDKDVTVRRADLGRECRSLVSYALGCAFGRYDPKKPGLQYAGGPETNSEIGNRKSEIPVYLSVLDDEYSESDAVRQVKQFLREVYGEKYYVENLHFLEAGLGKDLRSYLRNDFYADHLKIYQKRPIYWLFQSPKGSFQALIYLHRYSSGTVAAVQQAARDYYNRLAGQAAALKSQADNAAGAERRKAEKQLTAVQSAMTEVKTWEKDVLAPLAEARIELDLDDGVKVNYAKFGEALAKIK